MSEGGMSEKHIDSKQTRVIDQYVCVGVSKSYYMVVSDIRGGRLEKEILDLMPTLQANIEASSVREQHTTRQYVTGKGVSQIRDENVNWLLIKDL
jgi:hypothetical protein